MELIKIEELVTNVVLFRHPESKSRFIILDARNGRYNKWYVLEVTKGGLKFDLPPWVLPKGAFPQHGPGGKSTTEVQDTGKAVGI